LRAFFVFVNKELLQKDRKNHQGCLKIVNNLLTISHCKIVRNLRTISNAKHFRNLRIFLLRDKYNHLGIFYDYPLSLCNVENINNKLTRNVGKSL